MVSKNCFINFALLIFAIYQDVSCAGQFVFTAHDNKYYIKEADETQRQIISELCNFDTCCVCFTPYVTKVKTDTLVPLDPPVHVTCGGVHSICGMCYKKIVTIQPPYEKDDHSEEPVLQGVGNLTGKAFAGI